MTRLRTLLGPPLATAALALLTSFLGGAARGAPAETGRVAVRPADHGRALVNPGMGFVLHHYDNSLVQYGSRLAPGGQVAVTLKDERGGIDAVLVDPGLDVRTLPVGPPGEARAVAREASLRLPAPVKPGTYDLFVSIGSAIGTPEIALPHEGDDGQRRVRFGQVRVLPPGAQR